ncbi:MAG TPA: SDR family oxidoreductase [Alphaproteobacteria bacterium]|nr:SDR family oxidoreductase [Alphaproteobacteria bacterium]
MTAIDLDGRVVIVTGASRGLGRAMAQSLAESGAKVVVAAPEAEIDRLGDAVGEIDAATEPGTAYAVTADITVPADCERLVKATIRHFGGLHVLINNARRLHRGPGLPPEGNSLPVYETDPAIWRETITVNVNGTFNMTRAVLPTLMQQKWGRIINITTSLGTMQRRHNSPYGVTKAALEAATLIWAQDLAGTGVTVNSLIPGGSCDSDPDRPPAPHLLPVTIMNPVVVWLASPLSDGHTGERFVGKLWDASKSPEEAARGALEPPVLRTPDK